MLAACASSHSLWGGSPPALAPGSCALSSGGGSPKCRADRVRNRASLPSVLKIFSVPMFDDTARISATLSWP